MKLPDTTICAPVHQPGNAICIIRVSGPDAISTCNKIFIPKKGKLKLTEHKGFTLLFGNIVDGERVIDEVLLTIFRSPLSYTSEDMVEISAHGSAYIIRTILSLLTDRGVDIAGAGEFTRRAFMNGKLDLSQAEAVADLINTESEAAHNLAMQQLRGGFSDGIKALRGSLLHFASLIELELDFGEEDVEFADRGELIKVVTSVKEMTEELADSFSLGNAIKKGIPVAIAGRPNSGKSTLLNALLREERAIVSEIPGTTRDYIEDTVTIGSVMFRFIDTAGIRETEDVIENLGISRSFAKIDEAAIVILVHDITSGMEHLESALMELRSKGGYEKKRIIIAINKIDLADNSGLAGYENPTLLDNETSITLSAKSEGGALELQKLLSDHIAARLQKMPDLVVTNARHYTILKRVAESLSRVLNGLSDNIPSDLVAIDIRHAIHHLGEITGEISTDEILGNIFKNFCIGK